MFDVLQAMTYIHAYGSNRLHVPCLWYGLSAFLCILVGYYANALQVTVRLSETACLLFLLPVGGVSCQNQLIATTDRMCRGSTHSRNLSRPAGAMDSASDF